jgi:hypothetical protein
VVAREPTGAIGGDREHRQLAERIRERGQELERRLVRPLQVVEHNERVALRGDVGEGAADRLEQHRPIRGRRGFPELGQQQRKLGAQRAAAGEAVAFGAPVAPERSHDRTLRSAGAVARRAAQDHRVRVARESATSRVLPTPASPLKSTIEPAPRRACSSAPSSRASSSCRPTSALRALMHGV